MRVLLTAASTPRAWERHGGCLSAKDVLHWCFVAC